MGHVTRDGRLWRIGAGRARSLGATQLDPGIGDVAASPTGVWVVNPIAGTLTHVDPETTRIVRTIELDGIPRSVALADDAVSGRARAHGATAATTSEVKGSRRSRRRRASGRSPVPTAARTCSSRPTSHSREGRASARRR